MTTCLTKIGGANAGGPRQGAILLGCTGPAASSDTFTFSRKRHVEMDGKVADAVLGRFQKDKEQFVMKAAPRKGARDAARPSHSQDQTRLNAETQRNAEKMKSLRIWLAL
jgi:hypothetical protein